MERLSVVDDNVGIAISWLFILQCLGEQVLSIYAPELSWNISSHTHLILVVWIMFFAAAALSKEPLKMRNARVKTLMVPGLVLIGVSALLEFLTSSPLTMLKIPELVEVVVATAGNVLIIAAHHRNIKLVAAYNAVISVAEEPATPFESEPHCI